MAPTHTIAFLQEATRSCSAESARTTALRPPIEWPLRYFGRGMPKRCQIHVPRPLNERCRKRMSRHSTSETRAICAIALRSTSLSTDWSGSRPNQAGVGSNRLSSSAGWVKSTMHVVTADRLRTSPESVAATVQVMHRDDVRATCRATRAQSTLPPCLTRMQIQRRRPPGRYRGLQCVACWIAVREYS